MTRLPDFLAIMGAALIVAGAFVALGLAGALIAAGVFAIAAGVLIEVSP